MSLYFNMKMLLPILQLTKLNIFLYHQRLLNTSLVCISASSHVSAITITKALKYTAEQTFQAHFQNIYNLSSLYTDKIPINMSAISIHIQAKT